MKKPKRIDVADTLVEEADALGSDLEFDDDGELVRPDAADEPVTVAVSL